MRPSFIGAFLLCALTGAPALRAQDVEVNAITVRGGLEAFFLQDFDISAPGTGPVIFRLEINNRTETTISIRLRMEVASERKGPLSSGQTETFELPPGMLVPMLTNNDLFTNSGPYRLTEYQVEENVVSDLLSDVLSTGKLPSDVYRFSIVAIVQNGEIQGGSDQFDIRVTNPSKLDLIFPGSVATGNPDEALEIFTNLPQFRWETDLRLCQVIVAEGRPGEDPESALNQEPRFVRNFYIQIGTTLGVVPDFPELPGRIEVLPAPTFQYPASGTVLTLRPGRHYYWRVTGFIQSSSGAIPLDSEIFSFRIADLASVASGSQKFNALMRALLGSDYDAVFGEGGELEGFLPKRMSFEGKDVTAVELLTRLRKLRNSYSGYKIER